jgi:hypothetical protein
MNMLTEIFGDMWTRIDRSDPVERVIHKPTAPKPTPHERINFMHNYRLLRRAKLAAAK